MADKIYLTRTGMNQYEEELDNLKHVQRKEIAQKIKEAREQGDLSENAEYAAAKEEQGKIEGRIEKLEAILKNAEVVEEESNTNIVSVGHTVTILDIEMNEEIEYQIVGTTEADSLNGKISNESPLGRAIIGAEVGDVIKVDAPIGQISYKILGIRM